MISINFKCLPKNNSPKDRFKPFTKYHGELFIVAEEKNHTSF